MTKEEKELLLRDLCARLPYGVQGITSEGIVSPLLTKGEADWDILTSLNYRIVKHGWKPYLRPMSSMDSKEIETYRAIIGSLLENSVTDNVPTLYNFLNSKHLDYNGLIFRGLALEAPKDMYNTKIE